MSSTDNEMCVRPGSFIVRGRYGCVWPVGREVQQLEHEAVADEVARGHAERRREPHELRRELVGRVDLAVEREPEQLAVEALRPFEIGHALARRG